MKNTLKLKQMWIIILLLFINPGKSAGNDAIEIDTNIFVTIKNGDLQGAIRKNVGTFYAFEGVPYAEPPINEKRFEISQLLNGKWSGIRDATKPGSICTQWDHFNFNEDRTVGEEDCLFLNVYTPDPKAREKMPVIVHLHGGGFMYGNGYDYGPDYIVGENPIVYVSVNYRLGPLGFLATDDEVVPGNMGLKDQVLALKWVQENIHNFGGDRSRVTLTGYSAGGASVHFHYFSPLSRGLFANGISHSGCTLDPWVFCENVPEKTKFIASELNCPVDDNNLMIECLKKKSDKDIVRQMKKLQPFHFNPISPFGPIIETLNISTTFLHERPAELLRQGNYQKLPWIVSFTEQEGLYPAGDFVANKDDLETIDRDWNALIPHLLEFNYTLPENKHDLVSQKIRQHYFKNGEKLDKSTVSKIIDIISDRLFIANIAEAIQIQQTQSPVYSYEYRFGAKYGLGNYLSKTNDTISFGVAHGDDIMVFYKTPTRDGHPLTQDERRMAKHLLQMYFSFSATNVPEFGNLKMETTNAGEIANIKYLEILNPDTYGYKISDDIGQLKFWKQFAFDEN